MPEGTSRSFSSCPPARMVWPAFVPPWQRTTRSDRPASRSVAFPLPSSPHWVPTRIVSGTPRFYRGPAGRPLALDAELDPDVRVVLLDLVPLDHGAGLEHVHPLDPPERLARLGQGLGRGVPPRLGRHTHQVDRLDHRHLPLLSRAAGPARVHRSRTPAILPTFPMRRKPATCTQGELVIIY